jgi:hypothetical protein
MAQTKCLGAPSDTIVQKMDKRFYLSVYGKIDFSDKGRYAHHIDPFADDLFAGPCVSKSDCESDLLSVAASIGAQGYHGGVDGYEYYQTRP